MAARAAAEGRAAVAEARASDAEARATAAKARAAAEGWATEAAETTASLRQQVAVLTAQLLAEKEKLELVLSALGFFLSKRFSPIATPMQRRSRRYCDAGRDHKRRIAVAIGIALTSRSALRCYSNSLLLSPVFA